MKFIDPKTDYAFKKIFASENSKDILISFLNALVYNQQSIIQDLEIIDPYNQSPVVSAKDSFLDVIAILDNGTKVIIEMQVANTPAFGKRVVYNVAKTYGNQLRIAEKYVGLRPVISLTITNFIIFENTPKIITKFIFKEQEEFFDYPHQELEMVFVELPKFDKELSELEGLIDKWLYFIKQAPSLEVVPENMGTVPEINKAFTIAMIANLTMEEYDKIQRQELKAQEEEGIAIQAREDGLKQGLQQGLRQGLEQGLQQGKQQERVNLISRQLNKRFGEISEQINTQIQQLSMEQLEQISELIFDWESLEDLLTWLQPKN